MGGVGSLPGERPVVLAIDGSLDRADIAELCRRVGFILDSARTNFIVCDVGALTDPDAVAVDALARLQLTARRLGCRVGLIYACPELQALLELMGLSEVVPLVEPSVEARGQTEEREDPRGVEEEGDPADPIP